MNKTIIFLGLIALVIGVAVIAPKNVLAYQGDPSVKGPNYTEERHTAMQKAFETKDYNAWKTLMAGKGRVTQVINAENFSKFAEAHLTQDAAQAKKILAELGLGLRNGTGKGQGMGYGCTNR